MVFRLGWGAINDSLHDWDIERKALSDLLQEYNYENF